MSEKWVLVPTIATPDMEMASRQKFISATPVTQVMLWASNKWPAMIAARPPVSGDWLDAAVERGARALAEQQIRQARRHDWTPHQFDEFLSTSIAICWPEYVDEARAAILAALEMTDEQ